MTTTQHTNGPWIVTFGKHDASIHTDVTIARISDEAHAWKANARLIAAAPRLLEVLKDILPEFISLYEQFDPTGEIAVWEQWTEEAMEVIAKAEGRTE
jgi:hypothetical protein